MASWTAEAPGVVERLLKENAPEVRSLARFLRRRNPALVLAAARGRGGLAALYAKHPLAARLPWPVLPSAPPQLQPNIDRTTAYHTINIIAIPSQDVPCPFIF